MLTRFWLVPVLVGCACPLSARGSAGKPTRAAGSARYTSLDPQAPAFQQAQQSCRKLPGGGRRREVPASVKLHKAYRCE